MEQPLSNASLENDPNFFLCPSCKSQMPREMRFCRSCGYRLGEGVAEFSETIRLPGAPAQTARPQKPVTNGAPFTGSPGNVHDFGGMAPAQAGQPYFDDGNQQYASWWLGRRRRRRVPWILWVVAAVAISTASGGGILRLRMIDFRGPSIMAPISSTRSMLGVPGLNNTPQGVSFDDVEPPGSPSDKAGLVGGDVITSFDGKDVKTADDLRRILAATPIGHTVDVTYLRDGEPKTTKLTTASAADIDALKAGFAALPHGFLGIGNMENATVPGTNIKGVQVGVNDNGPAYIAGLEDKDIITEFGGVPIRTEEELTSRIRRTLPKSQVKVVVMRGGQRIELPITVGTR